MFIVPGASNYSNLFETTRCKLYHSDEVKFSKTAQTLIEKFPKVSGVNFDGEPMCNRESINHTEELLVCTNIFEDQSETGQSLHLPRVTLFHFSRVIPVGS